MIFCGCCTDPLDRAMIARARRHERDDDSKREKCVPPGVLVPIGNEGDRGSDDQAEPGTSRPRPTVRQTPTTTVRRSTARFEFGRVCVSLGIIVSSGKGNSALGAVATSALGWVRLRVTTTRMSAAPRMDTHRRPCRASA